MARSINPTPKSDDFTKCLDQVRDAIFGTHDELLEAELHRAYFDGYQWTDEEKKELKKRGQAAITDNLIKDKVEFMLGFERKTRTDPECNPRNLNTDESMAQAATDGLRYVCDDNRFNARRSEYFETMMIEGLAACEITVDPKIKGPDKKSPKIVITEIERDRVYFDPLSRRRDFGDKRYCGIVTWFDEDDAKEKWPEKIAEIDASFEQSSVDREFYQDRPYFFSETKTRRRRRVQVFQHEFIHKGVWHKCKFVAGGFLEEPAPSPYIDFDTEQPQCCLELEALYREKKSGRCYGIIRRFKDPQDEWNKRASKALHHLQSNKLIGPRGAFGSNATEIEATRREMARPDGVVEVTPGMEFQVENGLQMSAAHIEIMQIRGQSLRQAGPNAALSGTSGDISGRAKAIDQQGGTIAIDYPFDSGRELTNRVYRQVWNRIKQYWTEETWVRVRDEEQVKFTALNRKVTRGEVIAAHLATQQEMSEEEKAQVLAMVAADPQYKQPMTLNSVADIDVDITIDETPDVVNLQAEQFNKIIDLAKSKAVQFSPKTIIKASQLRNKREILADMIGSDDPVQQQLQALKIKVGELEAMKLEAEVRELMSRVTKNEAATAESKVDASVKLAEFMQPSTEPAEKQVRVN